MSKDFEKQVAQIAALGVWSIVTGGQMKRRLEPIPDDRWDKKLGLFVSLKKEGKLRGNMGLIETTTVLAETLFDVAAASATHDQRFPPVTEDELKNLEIEINIIEEIKPFEGLEKFEVGRWGLMISRGEQRAILLPHVAQDYSWSPEQFLEATCEKAGLSHKAWRDPNTLVEIFSVLEIKQTPLLTLVEGFI